MHGTMNIKFLTLLALRIYVGHVMCFTHTVFALITVWSVGTVCGVVTSSVGFTLT